MNEGYMCIGGPLAGTLQGPVSENPLLYIRVPIHEPRLVGVCLKPNDIYTEFVYRLINFGGVKIYAPNDWTLGNVFKELLENYFQYKELQKT